MAINLRDYSHTAAQRGWGAGWPSCGGVKTAGTAVVQAAQSGVRLSVHKRLARLVLLLIDETERRGYLLKSGQCGGYNCRAIAGTSSPSNHSWALAIDLNWQTNPYAQPLRTDFPEWLPQLWNRYGFAWGGDYNDRGRTGKADAMHLEFMGSPADADAMTALALRELAAQEDDMSQAQYEQLRRDIGYARDQILTAIGVDPAKAPASRPPVELAAIAVARRGDVGWARDQIMSAIGADPAATPAALAAAHAATQQQLDATVNALDELTRRVLAIEAK